MLQMHLRFAALGALIGLMVALTPGCQKPCGPDTCASGCCSAKGECTTATSTAACGKGGATCSACGTDQTCTDGVCVTPMTGGGNGGDGGTDEDAGVDAGPACSDDFDCGPGKICTDLGECIDGTACQDTSQCQPNDPNDRCYRFGRQCVCDTSANGGGVCRVRKAQCDPCTDDFQCGNDDVIFGPPDGIGDAKCKALPNDTSGAKFCSYRRVNQCTCGTVDDGTGYCRPMNNSCDSVGCNSDRDCGAGSFCTVNDPDGGATCGGICVPRCHWNFSTRQQVNCPSDQTCWVDSANLDPASDHYGSGRCRPACTSDDQCHLSPSNPQGGDNLKCAGEVVDDQGNLSPKRCRANGDCMDDAECPEINDGGPYVGYCDRGLFVCKGDCRTGSDPSTNLPYKDCRTPYSCANDGAGNYCKLETCTQQGGATIACRLNQYCCGDDKNFDGQPDLCPPVSQQDPAGCYTAPAPPFCQQCMDDSECNPPHPGYALCPDGGINVNCSNLTSRCVQISMNLSVCGVPSINSAEKVNLRYGPVDKTKITCPVLYNVEYVRPQVNGDGNNYCETNEECGSLPDGGTSDAGLCMEDTTARKPDGGFYKTCQCDAKSGTSQCPAFNVQGAQVNAQCKDGATGSRQYCIETVLCVPNISVITQTVENGGCGFMP